VFGYSARPLTGRPDPGGTVPENWAAQTLAINIIPSLLFIMSGCGKWQSKDSTQMVDICPVCKFSYPSCQTCLKYGRQSHTLYQEKSLNAHDNAAFEKDEKDPKKSKNSK
jgi:hypothetical protein